MIDQCIPELQHFEECEEDAGTQVSGRCAYRGSNIYKVTTSQNNTPIGTNCTMTPTKRGHYNQVVVEDMPDDHCEVR